MSSGTHGAFPLCQALLAPGPCSTHQQPRHHLGGGESQPPFQSNKAAEAERWAVDLAADPHYTEISWGRDEADLKPVPSAPLGGPVCTICAFFRSGCCCLKSHFHPQDS